MTPMQMAEGWPSVAAYLDEYVNQVSQDLGPQTVAEICDAHGLKTKHGVTYVNIKLGELVKRGHLKRQRRSSGRRGGPVFEYYGTSASAATA